MRQRLRPHLRTLIGGALLLLIADSFILCFRIIGLPRESAIYAGLLTFTLCATLVMRRWPKRRTSPGDTRNG